MHSQRLVSIVLLCGLAPAAIAQQQVSINLAGVQFRNATNQFRSSAPATISPAYRYHYVVDGMVHGVGGALGLLFPTSTPLATAMDTLSPGSSASLTGDGNNCSGALPYGVPPTTTTGSRVIFGVTVNYEFTITMGFDAGGVASFSITNVTLSPAALTGYVLWDSGTATLTRVYVCPANCDASTTSPVLNVQDFSCFLNRFASGDTSANCDCSTVAPILNIQDFSCFINRFATGCPPP